MKDQGFKPTPQIWSPPVIQPIASFGYIRAKKFEQRSRWAGLLIHGSCSLGDAGAAPYKGSLRSMTQDRSAPRHVGAFGSEDPAIRCQGGAAIGAIAF